ncbi:MAG TPA: hypothetical protein DCZ00_06875 [Lactococcus sp.]|uniref:hypothetical protein n=1 Tax=Lactococcus TaxID=1357 RepID=UPI000E858F72|nr:MULTISPECIES: hypothetical protein [Lactococcus]HAP14781.1 hypothetical protein [Lactococcus sp.]HBC91147.1 hypothetical protein [Lactococcus sp.]
MNANRLKIWIDSLTDDIEFSFNGKHGAIMPFNRSNISLGYDGEVTDVTSVEAAMSTPFIEGKNLNEIAEQLEF